MSVALTQLVQYLEHYLQPGQFQDYCPNGLQVQGRPEVKRVVTGVTASQALVDAAVASRADVVLVHHGYFWRGEDPCIVGMKKRRLAALLGHDISLLAYHLPLDAHPEVGNNACIGRKLGFDVQRPLQPGVSGGLGNIADLPTPMPVADLVARVEQLTGSKALHIAAGEDLVRTVAWCTGAAQDYLAAAVGAGADLFLTGEVSEQTVHIAREEGIHFLAAGHHATERFGVQSLGEHLAGRFGLSHQFIDIANPV